MNSGVPDIERIGRRAFLQQGTLILTAAAITPGCSNHDPASNSAQTESLTTNLDLPREPFRIGLITDLHYADKPPAANRYYQETIDKLAEAAVQFEINRPKFVVELGDLIDKADSVETELKYLKTINREFSAVARNRHYVLGNHCVDTLTKTEFLDQVEQKESYYSFDQNGFHFVVLDACFTKDFKPYGRKNSHFNVSNISPAEMEWLKGDLKANHKKKTIVFVHQRLDTDDQFGVINGAEVRQILEKSGNVLAVFQGHNHKNDLKDIAGIHYCTLYAMVDGSGAENNSYSVMEIAPNGTIQLNGFRQQTKYDWKNNA